MSRPSLRLPRIWSRALALFLLSLTPLQAADVTGTLVDPIPTDLAFLAYMIAGAQAPFDTWAQADGRVTSLDEFRRGAAAQALATQMRARSNEIKNIRQVRFELATRFGEYNSQYGEYDFDISDGMTVTFNTSLNERGVVFNLTNGGEAQSWTLSSSDAEKILDLTHGNRFVTLSMVVQLTGATLPATASDSISIDTKIVAYDIISDQGGLRLGHIVVK